MYDFWRNLEDFIILHKEGGVLVDEVCFFVLSSSRALVRLLLGVVSAGSSFFLGWPYCGL